MKRALEVGKSVRGRADGTLKGLPRRTPTPEVGRDRVFEDSSCRFQDVVHVAGVSNNSRVNYIVN